MRRFSSRRQNGSREWKRSCCLFPVLSGAPVRTDVSQEQHASSASKFKARRANDTISCSCSRTARYQAEERRFASRKTSATRHALIHQTNRPGTMVDYAVLPARLARSPARALVAFFMPIPIITRERATRRLVNETTPFSLEYCPIDLKKRLKKRDARHSLSDAIVEAPTVLRARLAFSYPKLLLTNWVRSH